MCSNTRTITETTTRYSEDLFVTADDTNTTNSTTSSLKKQDSIDSQTANDVHVKKRNSKSLPIKNDGTVDYDGMLMVHHPNVLTNPHDSYLIPALYEDDSDDGLSMESHGSVVSHLLSQVKIGMDLTKVVLPTFILERRSLLEMYADYFAHPDLFLR